MAEDSTEITRLLDAVGAGDSQARERLWEVIYRELRLMAASQVAAEQPGRGVQATTLVHEAYLRLFSDGNERYTNRRHFFGAAAQAMRRILVDDARNRGRLKRGGDGQKLQLSVEPATFDTDPMEVLALEQALQKLEQNYSRAAEIVQLRYFTGLTVDQTAELLGVAPRTVDAEWCMARAWLSRELGK